MYLIFRCLPCRTSLANWRGWGGDYLRIPFFLSSAQPCKLLRGASNMSPAGLLFTSVPKGHFSFMTLPQIFLAINFVDINSMNFIFLVLMGGRVQWCRAIPGGAQGTLCGPWSKPGWPCARQSTPSAVLRSLGLPQSCFYPNRTVGDKRAGPAILLSRYLKTKGTQFTL